MTEPPPVPPELARMLDEDAGKTHSATGTVMASLARILARHEQMVRERVAGAIADADDACGAPVCGCCEMQREVSEAIARGGRR